MIEPDANLPDDLKAFKQKDKSDRLQKWGLIGLLLTLTVGVVLLYGVAYANRGLPALLDAQRDQFTACKDVSSDTPGCEKPVVSEKEVEDAKDGVVQLPGIPGDPGAQGPVGPQGPPPPMSLLVGLVNQAVVSVCGNNKCDGPPGANGADGLNGPPGTNGADGADGADGKDGKEITGVRCEGSTGVFDFNDGSVIEVANMCAGPPIIVDPEPTPTP